MEVKTNLTATTKTTRFDWSEKQLVADVTKVRVIHVIELREACDDMDERLDYHIGFGGTDRHPIVTDTVAGFMSPEQKAWLDEWRYHMGPNHTIINVHPSNDPTSVPNKEYVEMIKDSYAIRTGRYSFSTTQGYYTHTIDLSRWQAEWNAVWASKYPDKPNPGFQCVLIPAITGVRTTGGSAHKVTWYDYCVERIEYISRVNDCVFNVQVSVSGTGDDGHIDIYGCKGWANFTFTVLGASKNMFRDDGNIAGSI